MSTAPKTVPKKDSFRYPYSKACASNADPAAWEVFLYALVKLQFGTDLARVLREAEATARKSRATLDAAGAWTVLQEHLERCEFPQAVRTRPPGVAWAWHERVAFSCDPRSLTGVHASLVHSNT